MLQHIELIFGQGCNGLIWLQWPFNIHDEDQCSCITAFIVFWMSCFFFFFSFLFLLWLHLEEVAQCFSPVETGVAVYLLSFCRTLLVFALATFLFGNLEEFHNSKVEQKTRFIICRSANRVQMLTSEPTNMCMTLKVCSRGLHILAHSLQNSL